MMNGTVEYYSLQHRSPAGCDFTLQSGQEAAKLRRDQTSQDTDVADMYT